MIASATPPVNHSIAAEAREEREEKEEEGRGREGGRGGREEGVREGGREGQRKEGGREGGIINWGRVQQVNIKESGDYITKGAGLANRPPGEPTGH